MKVNTNYLVLGLSVILVILISVCVQQFYEIEQTKKTDKLLQDEKPLLVTQQLDNLCSGEEECINFCQNNRERCEGYCKENTENELCLIIFPAVERIVEKQVENEQREDGCEGTKIKFDYAPVNLDETSYMLPRGLMVGGHVTPVNHHYFQNFDNDEFDIEIYSPGKGYITDIGHMPGAEEGKDYHITIQHTCTIKTYYIYVSNLPEKIKAYAPSIHGYAGVRIPVEAGELIGYYKKNLDYNLIDEETTLSGFVIPEHYISEPDKIHIVSNTYDYFNEPIKSKLIEKSIRTIEPISGKIDYDVNGKLVGNWFLEGTNWYAGNVTGTGGKGYWNGHLSFVYDYIDPGRIVISIAGYGGEQSRQFSVKGNSPDPKDLRVESGLVKYELVGYEYITPGGSYWDRISFVKNLKTRSDENVQGVVLVQMISNRKIKFETFPSKTASQITGFTSSAKIYER